MKLSAKINVITLLSGLLALTLFSTSSYAASVKVMEPYARAVPPGQPNSAAFMVLINDSDKDRALVDARSNISKTVELHTHKKEDGMMRMRRIDRISVKAGSQTILKPGGLHVMFIGLKQQLKEGDTVDLELIFDDGSTVKLMIPVKIVAGMMRHRPVH